MANVAEELAPDASVDKRLDRLWDRARGSPKFLVQAPDIDEVDDMDDEDDSEDMAGGRGAKTHARVGSGGAPSRNPLAKKTRRRGVQQNSTRIVADDAIQALKMRQLAEVGGNSDVQRIVMEMKVKPRSLVSPRLPEIDGEYSCARTRPFDRTLQKTTHEQALRLHTHPPSHMNEDAADSDDSESSGLSSGLDSDDEESKPPRQASKYPAPSDSVASESRQSSSTPNHDVENFCPKSSSQRSALDTSDSDGIGRSIPDRNVSEKLEPEQHPTSNNRDQDMRYRDRRDRQRSRREREQMLEREVAKNRHISSSADYTSISKRQRVEEDTVSVHSASTAPTLSASAPAPSPSLAVKPSSSVSADAARISTSEVSKKMPSPSVISPAASGYNVQQSSSGRSSGRGKIIQLAVKLKRQADKMPKGEPGTDNWKVQQEMYMIAGLKFLEAAEEAQSTSQYDSVAQYFTNFAKTYQKAGFMYMGCICYQCAAWAFYRRFTVSSKSLQQQCSSLRRRLPIAAEEAKRRRVSPNPSKSPTSVSSPAPSSSTPQHFASSNENLDSSSIILSSKDADVLLSFLNGVKFVFTYQDMWKIANRLRPSQAEIDEHNLQLLHHLQETTMDDLRHVVRTACSSDYKR